MKRLLLSAFVLTLALGTCGMARSEDKPAEGMQPVLVVSLSSYDELRNDLEWIGKLGENTPLATQVESGLKNMLGVNDFAGLDKTRPWGLIVETNGQEFSGYAFLPVTDLKQLLKTFEEKIGKPHDAGNGVQELNINGQVMFIKESNGWAFISTSSEALAKLPKDPSQALDGLNTTYDVAVRVSVKNVPPMVRQMLMAPVQMGMQAGMERREGETDEQYTLRTKMAREAAEQLSAMINDLDTLQFGLTIDQKASLGRFEYAITAVEGTKTAAQMTQAKEQKTQFAGFLLPDATASLVAASELGESDIAQAKAALESRKTQALSEIENQGLSPDDLKLAKRLIGELVDVVQRTVEGKHWDGGAVLFLGADRLTAVAGSRVADTTKLEKLFKELADQATKEQPDLGALIKMDAEQHQGYRFHRIAVPASKLTQVPNLSKFVGSDIDVIVALGENSAYVAAGRDASKTLKAVIDKSKAETDKTIPPMQLTVAGTPVAEFVAAAAEDEESQAVAKQIADLLKKSEGKDLVIVTTTPIPNGAQVRVDAQPGILGIFGALPKMLDSQ